MIRIHRSAGILVVLALVIAACGGGGGTGTPTTGATQPAGTAAGGTAAPEPTGAATTAAETTAAAPTTPPSETACEGGGSGGSLTGELTLWHSYGSGAGTESDALAEALDVVCAENAGLKVDVVGLDFSGLFDAYQLQASGGDPDLFIAPNDSMWELADAQLLQDVTASIDASRYSELAIEGSTYNGQLVQVPESLKAVALYYNGDTVSEVPETTDDLLSAVEGGLKLGLLQGIYHNFGWWGAFGGELMDEDGRCVAADTGVADSFQYLKDLKAAGASFFPNYDDMAADFKEGSLDAIVDGPWAAGGYVQDIENLGVAPMPEGPEGPALPLTGVDGYNINPYGDNVELATAFADRMTQADIQQIYADVAYHIPSDTSVSASDNEVSAQFAEAVQNGALRPQRLELGAFWDNFGNALNQVIDEDADPATVVAEACQTMNDANGK